MNGWKRFALLVAPVVVLALLVGVNVSEWRTASRLREELAESQAHVLADEIKLGLATLLKERSNDLALLATIWLATPEAERGAVFMARAGSIVAREDSYEVINFVDSDNVIVLSAPEGRRPDVIGLRISELPGRAELIRRMVESGSPLASPLIDIGEGRKGMIIWQPVFSEKGFEGLVSGVLILDILVREAIPPTYGQFGVELGESGRTVFSNGASAEDGLLKISSDLEVLGRDFTLRVSPMSGSSMAAFVHKERIHLALGLGLSLAASLFLAMSLAALDRLKRSQSSLEHAKTRLRDQHNVLQGLVQNVPLGVQLWDGKGRLISCNEGFTRLTGYLPEDVVTREDWFSLAYPDPAYREMVESVWSEAAGEGGQVVRDFRIRRKDGGDLDVEFRAVFLSDGRILLTMSDITDRRRAQEALMEEKERAEAASKAKTEFLANMSHELRTPLNGIMTFLQVLAERRKDSPQDAQHVKLALESGRSLTRLLADILDLSRIEADRLALEEESFSVEAVLGDVRRAFEAKCRDKGLALEVEADQALPPRLTGDAVRLRQVLFNLVGNAVKFTREGRVRLTAHKLPSAPQGGERVLFTVLDTGPGLAEERLEELSEPFSQGASGYTRRHQGAGLGLGIVKRLTALMGGGLCVENPETGGTILYTSLLFKQARPEEDEMPPGVGRVELAPGTRVLLVEDERVNALALGELLKGNGCEVRVVYDGKESLKALREESFDCVLMDVQMPVMNGVDATRAIRDGEVGDKASDVPIVALTAYAMPSDRKEFAAAGMDGYVAKPVEEQALLAEMARVMAKRRRTRA